MGAYMGKPSTEKNATSGHNDWFTYGVSSMQGWRVQQEDAHNCVPDFDPIRHASLFAVYDGHGGAEVAEYCANHLPDFLRKLPAYSDKDPAEALKQLFLDFDASLLTPEARSVLRSLMKKSSSDDDLSDNAVDEADDSEEEENDSDINALCAEAEQPLESVLKRYGGEEGLPSDVKDLLESRKQNETDKSGPSSSHATSTKRQRRSSNTASTDSKDSADQKDDSAETKVSESTTVSGPDADETSAEKTDDAAGAEQDKDDDDSEDDSVDFEAAAADNEDEEDDSDDTSDSDEEDEDDDDDDDDEDEDETGFRLPAVLKGQSENEPGVDSGTTACVALLLPMDGVVKLFVANAGDSRAVLCRGAAAVELSVDHKPEDEDERSRITAAGGTVTRDGRVNGGLNLSRALGDHCYKQTSNLPLAEQMITPCPDVTQFDLIPGSDDFLVIACDGVWNSMTSQEVVDFIYTRLHPNPAVDSSGDKADVDKKPEEEAAQLSQICGDLFDRCLAPNTEGDGTGCDNMTCIIVRFRDLDSLAKLSPPKSDQLNSSELVEGRKRAANGDVATVTNGPSPKNGVKRLKTDLPEDTVNAPVSNGESVE